jgi:hypothetical protein
MVLPQMLRTLRTTDPENDGGGSAKEEAMRAWWKMSSSVLVLAAPAFALALALSGCGSERSAGEKTLGSGSRGDDAAVTGLALSDLPADLHLTADQRSQMGQALGELRSQRRSLLRAWRDRQNGGSGPPAGLAGEDPPILAFLEKSSEILSPDQFLIFARFLAQRREQMRAQFEARWNPLENGLADRAARRLGLTSDQREKMKTVLAQAFDQGRAIWKSLEDGTITVDQAREQAAALRAEVKSKAAQILTPEQLAKAEDLRKQRIQARIDLRLENMATAMDRRSVFLGRVLGLESGQTVQVWEILKGTIAQRAAILGQIKDGSLAPEDAAFSLWQIEKDALAKVRALLTPEQASRLDALLPLLHRGVRPPLEMGGGR